MSSASWRPVTLVQLDIDELPTAVLPELSPGDRVWVEAVKSGQIVGVIEARVEGNGISKETLENLRRRFADSVPASVNCPNESLPKATVVIPTICRIPAQLLRTVDSLLALDYPDFEIVIVDNRTGGVFGPLPEFPRDDRIHVVTEPFRGISAARNKGVSVATGEFVAFTDDDAVVDRNWLRVIGSRFARDPEVGVIAGLVLPMELQTAPQLWFEEFYGGFSQSFRPATWSRRLLSGTDKLFPYNAGRFGAGCNMAFRKSTVEKMGGFNKALGTGTLAKGGEDLAMFIEFLVDGGTLAFEPAAVVRHSHRRTETEFMKQVAGYGTGMTAMYTSLIARHPRLLVALASRVPAGLRILTRPRDQRSPSLTPSYPRRTLLYQIEGMAYGPIAYARSVIRTRQQAR